MPESETIRNETINYQEAIFSPCDSCSAPCCNLLQLQRLNVSTLIDLDLISYCLNFDNIAVSLSGDGSWTIYYRYACRFFNETNYKCSIHDMPAQPDICVHYNPYSCFYKIADAARHQQGKNIIWINHKRMQHFQSVLQFNTERKIIQLSEKFDFFALFEEIPYEDPTKKQPQADKVLQVWKEQSLSADLISVSPPKINKSFHEMRNPCSGCEAYCCKTLLFPQELPATYSNLDFYKYCLGFPGVELGISNSQWVIIVKTKCCNLNEHNKCSIYGESERPLICKYYDAARCTYKKGFGEIRPEGYMRIGYEEFNWLLESYRFDNHGNITVGWDTETLRRYVEDKWRRNPSLNIEKIL